MKESKFTIKNKLKAITDLEVDIGSLELSDIIDIELLHSMMDSFYQLTGMLGAVLDVSGKVLVAVGWQDICTQFHRCNPETLKTASKVTPSSPGVYRKENLRLTSAKTICGTLLHLLLSGGDM
ncbi:MAG: PocR ligand-binding domain-containing protein [Spirochaetales bacterium]|nr:PocR ligand-binding domain-containing protein [Spirochaetales bacterium]